MLKYPDKNEQEVPNFFNNIYAQGNMRLIDKLNFKLLFLLDVIYLDDYTDCWVFNLDIEWYDVFYYDANRSVANII